MYYPTIQDAELIVSQMNKRYNMNVVIINKGQLEFALDKPKINLYGKEQYQTLYQKAAVLMETINKIHALSDGNKRTAMMAADFMIKVNGGELVLPLKTIRLSVDTAMDENDLMSEEIQLWFKIHIAMNSIQLRILLEEHLEEEAILRTLLDKSEYEDAEKILSNWLAFDSYPEHKKAWAQLVENWKKSDKKIENKKQEKTSINSSDKWRSIVYLAKLATTDAHTIDFERKNVNDLLYRGHSLPELKVHEKRIKEREMNLQKKLNDIDTLWENAFIFDQFNRYEYAVSCFDKLIQIVEESEHPMLHKMQILVYDLDRYEEALDIGRKILKKTPDNRSALAFSGVALSCLKRNEEALEYLDKALKYDPENSNILRSKAIVLNDLGKNEESQKYYEKAFELDPEDVSHIIDMGIVLAEKGKNKEALKYYDKALKKEPDDVHALYNKGLSLHELDDIEGGLNCYAEVLKIDPDNIRSLINTGSQLSNMGKRSESLPYLKKALEIEPDHPVGLMSMGITLTFLKQYDEALKNFNILLKTQPENKDVLYNIAGIYSLQGKIIDSLECLEKICRIDPKAKDAAKKDDVFKNLRDSERFKMIINS